MMSPRLVSVAAGGPSSAPSRRVKVCTSRRRAGDRRSGAQLIGFGQRGADRREVVEDVGAFVELGEKPVSSQRVVTSAPATSAPAMATVRPGRRSTRASQGPYRADAFSSGAAAPLPKSARRSAAHRERQQSEAITAAANASASAAKKVPTTPERKASGANTTTVVMVDDRTGPASRDTPRSAASRGERPAIARGGWPRPPPPRRR